MLLRGKGFKNQEYSTNHPQTLRTDIPLSPGCKHTSTGEGVESDASVVYATHDKTCTSPSLQEARRRNNPGVRKDMRNGAPALARTGKGRPSVLSACFIPMIPTQIAGTAFVCKPHRHCKKHVARRRHPANAGACPSLFAAPQHRSPIVVQKERSGVFTSGPSFSVPATSKQQKSTYVEKKSTHVGNLSTYIDETSTYVEKKSTHQAKHPRTWMKHLRTWIKHPCIREGTSTYVDVSSTHHTKNLRTWMKNLRTYKGAVFTPKVHS